MEGGWRLRGGERMLWQGRPDVRAYTFASSWLLIPFSVLWAGFAFFWEASVLASGAPGFFALWGIPFVLMGLYILFGRFIVARLEAQKTTYAVTDLRVLIRTGAFRSRLTELDLTNLPPIELSSARFGTGTITFGPSMPYARWLGPSWFGMRFAPEFTSIPHAEEVFATLSEARQEAVRSLASTTSALRA